MIRRLRISDKDAYLAILQLLTNVGDISDSKWFLIFQEVEKNPCIEIYVLVAICDDKKTDIDGNQIESILAAGTLIVEPKFIHSGKVVGHIEDIVVAEKARGLGLGKEMVNFLVDRAQKLGAYKVILDSSENTCGFYEKLGFHKHEIQLRLDL